MNYVQCIDFFFLNEVKDQHQADVWSVVFEEVNRIVKVVHQC